VICHLFDVPSASEALQPALATRFNVFSRPADLAEIVTIQPDFFEKIM